MFQSLKLSVILFVLFFELFCLNDKHNVILSDTAMMAIKVQSIPDIVEIENWSNYETGIASWYGPGFHGRTTANGEKYNMYGMTAAHKKLKFGTKVRVTNLLTGKQIIVRINDRGPFVGGRVIDLSKTGMQELAGNSGLCKVKLEIIK